MSVYMCDAVGDVRTLYKAAPISSFSTTIKLMTRHAEILHETHQLKLPIVRWQISSWHPDLVGKSAEEILAFDFTIDQSQTTIAREFGFASWDDAKAQSANLDHEFEQCVDLALAGDTAGLRARLEANPPFAKQTSSFGHRATLLLYLAANGVETWRQVVPHNVVEIAELLVEFGADKQATMNVYGGQFDVVGLIESSAHPNDAGVGKDLVACLTN